VGFLKSSYNLEYPGYSSLFPSLIYKYATQNAICGNGVIEEGEKCDAGKDNGKPKQCSLDCLYIGEIRFSDL
jgi:hypothetical protein